MTDLELIIDLEQHAGFALDRLGCDGNIFANAVDISNLERARVELVLAFVSLRRALKDIKPDDLSRVGIMKNMDSFNTKDWND